jgi:LPPG:FO 2-phospho-L-lactate transferase
MSAPSPGPVVVLAGGTGGAKLARGMQDRCDELVVIANTADDVELYGAYVSPDPDLVSFWLADRIDERGWGLDGDTFNVMDGLRDLGVDVWFNLGDRDLAVGVRRQQVLAEGGRLTDALAELGRALGLQRSRVLPMADEPVRTRVLVDDAWWPFQEFMIVRQRAREPAVIQDVEFGGVAEARLGPEAVQAIAEARAIVIGPSNPIISILPILEVPGMREALRASPAPVVAVSPIVGGAVVKGPTEPFMAWAGLELSAAGVAAHYADVIDGIVSDETPTLDGHAVLTADTLMTDADSRERVAGDVLAFADSLRSGS